MLVIDSGSTDDTISVAQGWPLRLYTVKPAEFHHGKTRNFGAELSAGEFLVYITQDALPINNNWLARLTDNLKARNIAMVIGRQIPWDETKPPEKFFYFYNFPQQRMQVTCGDTDIYKDNIFISNVNSAVRRDVWQKFRFSEAILMAEDKELAKRVLSDGWSIVYEPEASVYHSHDLGLWSVFQLSVNYGVSLKQGVAGLSKSKGSIIQKSIRYFHAELRYLNATGCIKWLPYCLLYDATKYLGIFLGKTGLSGDLTKLI